MATAKTSAKKSKAKELGFEESLWDAANKLRGSVESAEYKHIVLSLIFLKFISDKFETQREKLISEGMADYVDMVEFYAKDNVFYLPEDARWSFIQKQAKQDDIAVKIDTALHTVEKNNVSLKGALPDNYFSRLGLDGSKLAALIDTINNIDTVANECEMTEEDLVGRVYEYFLGKFAASEGKGGGEFYTPKSIVALIAEMIEPYKGKIYDCCCGSGGMFISSADFVAKHNKDASDELSVFGQEKTGDTVRLSKLNLAVHGLQGDIREGNSYYEDPFDLAKGEVIDGKQHGQFDFVMANPPFNVNEIQKDRLEGDKHRFPYGMPRNDNGNYLWIQMFYSALNQKGRAGFVMANSASDARGSEQEIRQQLIEDDGVDVMVAVSSNFFYTVTLPCALWFLDKNKPAHNKDKVLFIDARHIFRQVTRAVRDYTSEQLNFIAISCV